MKLSTLAAVAIAGIIVLVACDNDHHEHHQQRSHNHFAAGDGAVNLDGDDVLIRAGRTRADARVRPDGSLSIGDQPIEISAEGQAALKTYDAEAVGMRQHAIALGRTGAEFGVDTLRNLVHGFFHGDVDEVGEHAREGALDLVVAVREMCTRMENLHAAQESAAAAIAEFKPYAVVSREQVQDCKDGLDEEEREHRRDLERDRDDGEVEKKPAAATENTAGRYTWVHRRPVFRRVSLWTC